MPRAVEIKAASFSPDVLDFFRALEKHRVECMVAGGEKGIVLQFGRPPHRIDLLNRIDGVLFAMA